MTCPCHGIDLDVIHKNGGTIILILSLIIDRMSKSSSPSSVIVITLRKDRGNWDWFRKTMHIVSAISNRKVAKQKIAIHVPQWEIRCVRVCEIEAYLISAPCLVETWSWCIYRQIEWFFVVNMLRWNCVINPPPRDWPNLTGAKKKNSESETKLRDRAGLEQPGDEVITRENNDYGLHFQSMWALRSPTYRKL